MKSKIIFLVLFACLSFDARSLEKKSKPPVTKAVDSRFVTYEYKEGKHNVNPLKTQVGKFTEIQLSDEEGKLKIFFSMGDKEGWTIKQKDNLLMLKPSAPFPDTNMKVWTDKGRVYWFDVSMAKKPSEVIYHVDFTYPDVPVVIEPIKTEPTPEELIAAERKRIDDEKQLIEERLGGGKQLVSERKSSEKFVNGDYGVIGSIELTPTSAFDNGELTVLTFAPNNPLPDVFYKEADGSESRVHYHMEHDMMVIHRVARKLILRRGDAVACLINAGFMPTGSNSSTKTVSDDVIRETRF